MLDARKSYDTKVAFYVGLRVRGGVVRQQGVIYVMVRLLQLQYITAAVSNLRQGVSQPNVDRSFETLCISISIPIPVPIL